MPFFRMFRRELEATREEQPDYGDRQDERISALVNLTQQVFNTVKLELELADFRESIPARNRLKAELQAVLLQPEFASLPNVRESRSRLISRIMEIAEKNNDIILYAK